MIDTIRFRFDIQLRAIISSGMSRAPDEGAPGCSREFMREMLFCGRLKPGHGPGRRRGVAVDGIHPRALTERYSAVISAIQ